MAPQGKVREWADGTNLEGAASAKKSANFPSH